MFLRDCLTEFTRMDVKLAPLFKTDNFLPPRNDELDKIKFLDVGSIGDLELGYIYKIHDLNKKKFYRVRQKHLTSTYVLKSFVSRTTKYQDPKEIKKKFIEQVSWWLEVREWMHKAYFFAFDYAT